MVFISLDGAPVAKYLVFVVGGTIYANKIAGIVMGILNSRDVDFRINKKANIPPNIKSYIKRYTR